MVPLEVAEAAASSHYASRSYGPDGLHPRRLVDGDKSDGGWITDVGQTDGIWLEFRFARPARVRAVEIVNGFTEGGGGYWRHLRPRRVRISFPGGAGTPQEVALVDDGRPQVFEVDSQAPVERARLDVLSLWVDNPDPTPPFDVVGLRHVEWRGD